MRKVQSPSNSSFHFLSESMVVCVSCKKGNPLGFNLLLDYSNCFKCFLHDCISLTLFDRNCCLGSFYDLL